MTIPNGPKLTSATSPTKISQMKNNRYPILALLLPMRICSKTPAASARIAIMVPKPEKLKSKLS